MRNLSEAQKGEQITVSGIEESTLRSKLMELGIIKGKSMRVLYFAPFGDPIAVDMDGFVLSLRKSEAKLIAIEQKAFN